MDTLLWGVFTRFHRAGIQRMTRSWRGLTSTLDDQLIPKFRTFAPSNRFNQTTRSLKPVLPTANPRTTEGQRSFDSMHHPLAFGCPALSVNPQLLPERSKVDSVSKGVPVVGRVAYNGPSLTNQNICNSPATGGEKLDPVADHPLN